MSTKMMESYLDNIAEQVVDEDKIVTYKSLSRSLGIHVNTSKQLLYTYLTKEKSKNAFPMSATYLIAGKVVDGSFNIAIVNEADLKDARSTFIEVTSEHVYSVQKGKNLKDLKVLCGIYKEQAGLENSKLVISCSKAKLISTGEVKKKMESYEETNKKAIKEAFLPEKPPVSAPKPVETKEKTKINTNKESKSPKKTSPKGNQQKAQDAVKKSAGNIANMFAKAAQKNTIKSDTTEKSDKNPSKEHTEPKVVDVSAKKSVEVEKTEKQDLGRSESTESFKRKKKGNKRKRIQMLSDSEDEDSNDEEEEVEEEPRVDLEEDEDNIPSTIDLEEEKEFIPKNKRKKRKVIDKTVMNADGYLETKKEVVFETDSEPEDASAAAPEKNKDKTEPVNKGRGVQSSGMAKKQSSLLSFFKKS